jgi:hypothetical protein
MVEQGMGGDAALGGMNHGAVYVLGGAGALARIPGPLEASDKDLEVGLFG